MKMFGVSALTTGVFEVDKTGIVNGEYVLQKMVAGKNHDKVLKVGVDLFETRELANREYQSRLEKDIHDLEVELAKVEHLRDKKLQSIKRRKTLLEKAKGV